MATKKVELVEIRPINIQHLNVRIVGDTPLIVHAWSEKAKKMMLDAQMGKAKTKKKEAKNPNEDFINSMYWLTPKPDEMTYEAFEDAVADGARFGFPLTAIKQASISAAYRLGWIKNKMEARGAFYIEGGDIGGDLLEIHGDPPVMREDMVKIGMGTADLRYRGEFRTWYIDLDVSYNAGGNFTADDIINMINAGGYVCGIGEWRPERDGQNGMYHVMATE